jgi:hypothetical protein
MGGSDRVAELGSDQRVTLRHHGRLIGVEPKAHSGGPFPLGLGPTRSTEHGVLTAGTGGRRRAVIWCVRQWGFFLELRRRRGTVPRLLRPQFISHQRQWRLLFLDDRSDEC